MKKYFTERTILFISISLLATSYAKDVIKYIREENYLTYFIFTVLNIAVGAKLYSLIEYFSAEKNMNLTINPGLTILNQLRLYEQIFAKYSKDILYPNIDIIVVIILLLTVIIFTALHYFQRDFIGFCAITILCFLNIGVIVYNRITYGR